MHKDDLISLIQKMINDSGVHSTIMTVSRNKELSDQINIILGDASISNSGERLYALMVGESYHCDNGRRRKFKSFSEGYRNYCGKGCECAKTVRSNRVTQQWQNTTEEGKDAIFKKARETLKDETGYEYALQNPESLETQQNTCLERHGDKHPIKLDKFKDMRVETVRDIYGVDNVSQNVVVKSTRVSTNLIEYGFPNAAQNEGVIKQIATTKAETPIEVKTSRKLIKQVKVFKKNYKSLNEKFKINCHCEFVGGQDYKGNGANYNFTCLDCGNQFEDYIYNGHLPVCKVCHPPFSGTSSEENEIRDYLNSLGITLIQSDKSILGGKELDLVCTEKKIAIEYCGLWFHAEFGRLYGIRGKDYHIGKMKAAAENGYRLITIFGDEWLQKKDIVKTRLRGIFGLEQPTYGARSCTVREISTSDAKAFLASHHIQGYVKSQIRLGLFYNNELVSCMTFGDKRISNNQTPEKDHYELLRFASKETIPGSAGKLLSYFETNYSPVQLETYADARWSNGGLYKTLGFELISTPDQAGYWYINKKDYSMREHRYRYTHYSLVDEGFDPLLTEWEIMQIKGYDRIWDCGNFKFYKKYL
jgi:hypothetical protein